MQNQHTENTIMLAQFLPTTTITETKQPIVLKYITNILKTRGTFKETDG